MQGIEVKGEVRPEDEPLPFLSNFQDVFLSVGLIIFLVGIGIMAGRIGDVLTDGPVPPFFVIAGLSGAVLGIVWSLSEIIVRKRRRILPGIILCSVFMMLSLTLITNLYGGVFGERVMDDLDSTEWVEPDVDEDIVTHSALRAAAASARDTLPWSAKGYLVGAPLLMLGAAFIYYRRFRLPFASAVVGTTAISAVFSWLFLAFPYDTLRFLPSIGLLSGLSLLAAAISFDMRDPERVTRWSGNGFWLHFFAAPMILTSSLLITYIGPSFSIPDMVDNDFDVWRNPFNVSQAIVTLIIIGVFAVISLLLNRRALVVAGLISAGVSISILVRASGMGGAEVAATTLIVLGGGVLLLGLGWNAARKVLLAFVPSSGFWGRVFPRVEDADG